MAFQPLLFEDAAANGFDDTFAGIARVRLDDGAWVDHLRGWVRGSDALFAELAASRPWGQRSRMMYDKRVLEPRLTAPWSLASGVPLEPAVLEVMRLALGARYGVVFDAIGFNYYRDGQDSVAWHSDRIDPRIVDPIVALVSVGEPRRFLLRPKAPRPAHPDGEPGRASRAFDLGRGDLLVTGGDAQRTWDHAIPKVARAGPRISLAFRYGLDPRAYAHKRLEPDTPDEPSGSRSPGSR